MGAFKQLFGPVRGEFSKNFPKIQMPRGVALGGMSKLRFDWYIKLMLRNLGKPKLCWAIIQLIKVAQNSLCSFILRLLKLGAIFQAWKCTFLNGGVIFKATFHLRFHCV